ncbi:hypothetical protein [uncultured Shewanella sp.]|uniref:hypothetical protein n=1 Tax=uncultured Shewanella sp. TaxID=173975 RepID=UPI0026263B78|nr:hypothetical protein [uncultured Shewanella sp.]
MSDQYLKGAWFLNLNTLLTRIMANNALDEPYQKDLLLFEQQMKSFLIQVNEYYLYPKTATHDKKQQAVDFSQQYSSLLFGLSQLYMGCLDPESARGRFDYGKERVKRKKHQQDVIELYYFIQKFYIQLVKQHPYLPIPNPNITPIYPVKN